MSNEPRFPPVIDATILSSMRCPRKFYLSHVCRYARQGHAESIHLVAGRAFAKGLEVAYLAYTRQQDPETCLELGTAALIEEYGDAQCPDSENKTIDRMVGALEFYFNEYPFNDDPARISVIAGIPAVEWRFALPLPFNNPDTGMPLLYAGRCDSIRDFCGARYANDEKTTKALGAKWADQWELRGQFTGYAWAGRELGVRLAGTIVRGVAILKEKYTTAQALVNAPDWKINEWVRHRDFLIRQAIRQYTTSGTMDYGDEGPGNYWEPALDDTCNEYGGCTFKDICSVPPERRINWLNTSFEESTWSPLTR